MVRLRQSSTLCHQQHAHVGVERHATSLRRKHVLQEDEAAQQQRQGCSTCGRLERKLSVSLLQGLCP